MKIRTIKLPKSLDDDLSRYAESKGASASAVLREALVEYLARPQRSSADARRPSFGELAADLAGTAAGPGDLSTNPKHLKDFGRSRR